MIGAISIAMALLSACLSAGSRRLTKLRTVRAGIGKSVSSSTGFYPVQTVRIWYNISNVICCIRIGHDAVRPGLARLSHRPKNAAGDLLSKQRLGIVFLLMAKRRVVLPAAVEGVVPGQGILPVPQRSWLLTSLWIV